jgi:hypothetical protein
MREGKQCAIGEPRLPQVRRPRHLARFLLESFSISQHLTVFDFTIVLVRNQGSEVRVCVELTEQSKTYGLVFDRITWFYFLRENPESNVRQNAIVSDNTVVASGLTDYSCVPGDDMCAFDTILRADFFDRAGVGIVRGIGEAICRYRTGGDSTTSQASRDPTASPSRDPTASPSRDPTASPSRDPTASPSRDPTPAPVNPTLSPVNPATPAPVSSTPSPITTYPPFVPYVPTSPIDYVNPTPAPGNYPNCGDEVTAVWSSEPSDHPLPTDAITILNQNETSVTFAINQHWKDGGISWIAVLYPDNPNGATVCPKYEEINADSSIGPFTANCMDDNSNPIRIYVELYVHDGSFGTGADTYVPEPCKPSRDNGKKIAHEVWIPCKPCEGRKERARLLSDVESLAIPGSADPTHARSPSNGQVKQATRPILSSPNKHKHFNRLVESKKRRSLQEEPTAARIEMDFLIVADPDGGVRSAGPRISTNGLGIMVVFTLARALVLLL